MSNPTLPTPSSTAGAPTSVLSTIEQKVRRLTRSPSTAQLSQTDLDQYINTFVVYDFPEILRTFNLRTQFSFFTNPGQDVYNTDIASFAGAINNPLYNFQNEYLTIHPPVYVAGYQAMSSQSREQLFGIYPKINNISMLPFTGDGTAGPFTGVINSQQTIIPTGLTQQISLLQGEVLFSAFGTPGTSEIVGMALVDVPVVDPATGFKINIGNLYDPNSAAYQAALVTPPTAVISGNNINYLTGAFTITFSMNTIAGSQISSQTVPTVLSLPRAVCFYSNQFIIRPVPDQSYRVNFEAYQRPTALLASNQAPELEEYWQFLAYGSAIKILQDRLDMDSVALLMPEFNRQERLCLRRTIVQNTNERVSSIYVEQTNNSQGTGWGWNGSGGGF